MSFLALMSCAEPPPPDATEEKTLSQAVFESSEYPITQATINTPEIARPAMECSQVVRVQGVHQGARVDVRDDNGIIGQVLGAPPGSVDVFLIRPLVAGEPIRAQQRINGVSSTVSLVTTVSRAPAFTKPEIVYDVYECSVGTKTHGLIPGALVTLTQDGTELAPPQWVTHESHYFRHADLDPANGRKVRVTQSLCDEGDSTRAESPIRTMLAPPNPLRAPRTFQPQAGTKWVRADGLIPGAKLIIDRLTPTPDTFYSSAPGPNVSVDIGIIADGSRFKVSQQLCGEPVSDKPIDSLPKSNLQDPNVFGPPQILEPVCASAKELLAKPSLAEGELVLKLARNAGPMTYQKRAPVDAFAPFSPLSAVGVLWAAGDRLEVSQIIESGFESPPANTRVVSRGSGLHAHNLTSYVDQVSGNTFLGITQEEQSGPAFTYQECCPLADGAFVPQDAQARVQKLDSAGNVVEEVGTFLMLEQSPGRYEGKWLWFNNETTDRPQDDYRYRVVVESRCNNPEGVLEFRVVTGKVNTSDSTPPESVVLELSSNPVLRRVTQDGNAASVTVAPGKVANLTVTGYDPEGLQRVQIISPSNKINVPTQKNLRPQVPVTKRASWTTNLRALDPLEQVVLQVEATNFAGATTRTGQLTVTANSVTPQINVVAPAAFYKEDYLDITGQSLYYASPNLETRVRFTVPSTSETRVVTVSATTANLAQSNQGIIKKLRWPMNLNTNVLDTVNISVGLGQPGQSDSQFQWSAPFAATAMEREAGTWAKVGYKDLSRALKTCSGDTGSVKEVRVTVTTQGKSVQRINLALTRKDISEFQPGISLEALDLPDPDDEKGEKAISIGGYYLSSNCRTLGVLFFTGYQTVGGASIPSFSSRFYYFPDSGPRLDSATLTSTGLFRYRSQNGVSSQEFVPRPWSMHISPDGTVAAITHVGINQTTQSNPGIQVFGSIHDLLKGLKSEVARTPASATCLTSDDCTTKASHLSKQVKIEITKDPVNPPAIMLTGGLKK